MTTAVKVNKGLLQSKEFKCATRFVEKGKKAFRPVLKYVQVLPEQNTIIATNSHILMQITDVDCNPYISNSLVGPKGELDNQNLNYPNTQSIIHGAKNRKHESRIENVSIADWLQGIDLLSSVSNYQDKKDKKKNPVIKLQNVDGKLKLSANNEDASGTYELSDMSIGEYLSIAFNPNYMEAVLKSFKDLKIKSVNMCFNGAMQPIVIEGENIFCLVLPVKTYN